jgi:protoporphyrinogen/coproporphyrinogen III oxidase
MNALATGHTRIAVIGAGISGLAAAHHLLELNPHCQVTLFDAAPRLGGVLSTLHEDGFQIEQSADNFITTVPWAVNLCKRLGLADQLVQTNPAHRRTFVVRRGRLHRLPDGFLMMAPTRLWPLALTPILSPLGKLRAGLEYFIPPQTGDADESMADFVRRRLGREVFDRLVEPLVGAVYAADMEKLSVLATLSRFREMERDYGSLIRAMRRQMKNRPRSGSESGARYSMFVTLEDGLSSLVEVLAASLPVGTVRLNAPVTAIELDGSRWRVRPDGEIFDSLILATPAPATARLLQPIDSSAAADLASIDHSGTAIVSLGYDIEQIGHPLDGMGVVVPAVENSPILACSFSSRKYPHRAPEGKQLLRIFVGGARHPELAEMDDGQLCPLVLDSLSRLLSIRGEPCYCRIAHWPGTMPQYHVGHKDLITRIEARTAAIPNLALAGNAYHGVGIPDCIHGGEQAAERIMQKSQPC